MPSKMLIVGLGGFIGANARYLVDGWVHQRLGPSHPYGTFVVNVTGSFVLGAFATLALRFAWNDHWRLLVAVGALGAYTTFSTYTYDVLQLAAQGRRYGAALTYATGSVMLGLCAAFLGIVAARMLLALHGRM